MKATIFALLCALIVSCLMNCSTVQKPNKICIDNDSQADCVSITFDSLINSQDQFEGKCIQLEGFLNWKFEHVGLFKSERMNFEEGAVWLGMPDSLGKQIDKFYPKGIPQKISIKGVFNRNNIRFQFLGELNNVTCIEIK